MLIKYLLVKAGLDYNTNNLLHRITLESMSKSKQFDQSNESFAELLTNKKSSQQDQTSFVDMMQGVKPIKQDKIHFGKGQSKQKATTFVNNSKDDRTRDNKPDLSKQAAFYFSDQYEPFIDPNTTLSFVKEGAPSYFSKLLRRGDIAPDVILDLHGYNKEQAKYDLADLIKHCKQQHIPCACIVHGISGGILKQKIPHYLMQHPDIAAFHQAPLEWGGQGAILVLVDLGEELNFLITE